MISKYINTGGFVLILLCFLMPIINIKCNDITLVSVKGIELVTGKKLKSDPNKENTGNMAEEESTENAEADSRENEAPSGNVKDIQPNILMIIILAVAFAGILFSLVLTRQNSIAAICCAAIIVICLAIFVVYLQKEINRQKGAATVFGDKIEITVGYDTGFWLMIIASLGIIGYNIYLLSQRRNTTDIGPII